MWRDLVLLHFRPPVAHLSLVADPDSLLLEEQVWLRRTRVATIC
jgi:hypothetical protein